MAFSQVAGKVGDSLSSGIDIFKSFRDIRGRRGTKGLFKGRAESKVSSEIHGRGSNTLITRKGKKFDVIDGKVDDKTGSLVEGKKLDDVKRSANSRMGEGKVSEIMEKSTDRTGKRAIEHGNESFRVSSKNPKRSKGITNTGKALRKMKQAKNLIKGGKGLKVLSSVAKKAGKKIPVVGGLIGAGLTIMENKDAFKDKATRGSAIGKTAGATVGSAIGGALGTFLGPLGSIAGAAAGEWVGKHIGGFIGGIQDKRVAKNSAIVDNQLKKHGIQRKGDYKVSDLKKIDNALQSGKMSNKLRRKLLSEGDTDIVKQIDDRKTEIEKMKEPKGNVKSRDKKHASMENDSISKNMGIVHFSVDKAYFSGSAFRSVGSGFENRLGTKLPSIGMMSLRGISPFSRFAEHGENKGNLWSSAGRIVSPLGGLLSPVKRTLGGFPLKKPDGNNGGNEFHGNIGLGILGNAITGLFDDKSNGINAMQIHENMAGIGNAIETGKKKHDEPHKGFSESFLVKNAVVEKAQINSLRENSKESDSTVKSTEQNGGVGAKLPNIGMALIRQTSPFSRIVEHVGKKGGLENGKGWIANTLGGISLPIKMSLGRFPMTGKETNEIAKHENKRNDGNVKEKAKSRKRNDYWNALLQTNIGSAITGIMPFINPVIGTIVGSTFGLLNPNRNEQKPLPFKVLSHGPLMEAFNSSGNKATKQIDESKNAISLGQYMKELIRRSDSFGKNREVGVTINGKFNPNNELGKTDYDTLIKEGKKTSGKPEIKAKPEKGESVEAKEMHRKAEAKASNDKKRDEERRKAEAEQRKRTFNGGKIDVNITGTIRLEANGKQFNMDELMKDSGFKQELAKLISEQIKYNSTQSNVVGRK